MFFLFYANYVVVFCLFLLFLLLVVFIYFIFFSLLCPFLATMSFAGYFLIRFLLSAFPCFFSPDVFPV